MEDQQFDGGQKTENECADTTLYTLKKRFFLEPPKGSLGVKKLPNEFKYLKKPNLTVLLIFF